MLKSALPLAVVLGSIMSSLPMAGALVLTRAGVPTAATASVSPVAQTRTLSVSGDAQVKVVPDRATFTVVVESSDPSKTRAQQLLLADSAKMIDALSKAGVPAAGLTVAGVSLSPVYQTDKRGQPLYLHVRYWAASRRLTICVEDLSKMNGIFGAAINAGGVLQGDVVFDTSRLEAVRAQARKLAAKAARDKAGILVDALGGELGAPITISENDPSFSGPFNYKNAVDDWRAGAFTDGSFSSGQMIVSAHVDVVFGIS